MAAKSAIIVGAGPAGASLAYLLARRGIPTTLLEKHLDFNRSFRGEAMQASGLDALCQMNLSDQLDRLPKAPISVGEIYLNGTRRARIPMSIFGGQIAMIAQRALLEMIVNEAKQHRTFHFVQGAMVRDVIQQNGRVAGVRADTPEGPREFLADIVIGTDGRNSILRKRGSFEEMADPQDFDVLWVEVPAPSWWEPGAIRTEVSQRSMTVYMMSSDGRLRIAFIIAKGGFKELRARPTESWTEDLIRRTTPEMAEHLRIHRDAISRAVFLDVVVGRLARWTVPGVLLIGDAAHPMSPIGGQGINVAIRDSLVAANHLCPVLLAGADASTLDAAARHVEIERTPEIVAMQAIQKKQGDLFMKAGYGLPLGLRLLSLLSNTGLFNLLMGKRAKALSHGVVPVRLTV